MKAQKQNGPVLPEALAAAHQPAGHAGVTRNLGQERANGHTDGELNQETRIN